MMTGPRSRCVTLLPWAAVTTLWVLLVTPVTPTMTSDLFFKVHNPTFPDLTHCQLESFPLSEKLTCAAQCQRISRCSMYCLSGGSCHLYNARVGRNWVGEGSPLAASCYSNWGSDLMSSASITASLDHSVKYKSQNAIVGFFCTGLDYCYCSQITTKAYLAISLGSYRRVLAIKIQTGSGYFRNVEVRVGNSSSFADDFEANIHIKTFSEMVTTRTVFTLTIPTILVGSVVSFLQTTDSTDYLCVCDVQIFVQ